MTMTMTVKMTYVVNDDDDDDDVGDDFNEDVDRFIYDVYCLIIVLLTVLLEMAEAIFCVVQEVRRSSRHFRWSIGRSQLLRE